MNAGDTRQRVWVDNTIASSSNARERGLTIGPPTPTAKGKRLIVLHIGSEDGFVENGLLCFESKTKSADYHDEMNAAHFFEWFKRTVPNLKPNAVIVMDNAPYHSAKQERCPVTSWNKPQIREWLTSKGIRMPDTALKWQLLDEVRRIKPKYDKYVIDEFAKATGRTILRLPPYHCELNPIELAWAVVKGHVKANNKTFHLADVKRLLIQGVEKATPEMWANFIRHTTKMEDKLYDLDQIIDDMQDNVDDPSFDEEDPNHGEGAYSEFESNLELESDSD